MRVLNYSAVGLQADRHAESLPHSSPVAVLDGVLPDPLAYRARALELVFGDLPIGDQVFCGMALPGLTALSAILKERFGLVPTVTAFRRSPKGQIEPNMVHHDRSMGDWTAILYLNPDPPATDGTTFWRDRQTGAELSAGGEDDSDAWADSDRWEPTRTIPAVFNRLIVFEAARYHSRALFDNYGAGDAARLIQVAFGTGVLPWV